MVSFSQPYHFPACDKAAAAKALRWLGFFLLLALCISHGSLPIFQEQPQSGGNGISQLQSVTDALNVVKTFGYDDFQRNNSITVTGPLPEHNLTLSKAYDARGILTAVEKTYTGTTPFGPAVRVERDPDAYGDIWKERVKVAGSLVSEFSQGFDAARRRTALDFLPTAQGDGAGRSRTFSYRADGLLAGTATGSTAFAFQYGIDGLFTSRSGAGVTRPSLSEMPMDVRPRATRCLAARLSTPNPPAGGRMASCLPICSVA